MDRDSPQSLALRITNALRASVPAGALAPWDRLPPTRQLAEELGSSRNIGIVAYEQPVSEDSLETDALVHGYGNIADAKLEEGLSLLAGLLSRGSNG